MARTFKILQIGEGNFLRCFFDGMVQAMNDRAGFGASVRIIQPRAETLKPISEIINAQDGIYHTCLRGLRNGETVEELARIDCVTGVDTWAALPELAVSPSLRFVVSNTTEAGIRYVKDQETFPARIARLLSLRRAAGLPGLVFLPCELIENNGDELKRCTLAYAADWRDVALADYIKHACVWCSTLVDQIVSGSPDAESRARYVARIGSDDAAIVCGEPFRFLAVRPPDGFDLERELPLAAADAQIVLTRDLAPYRTRKIRFLNAVHTSLVFPALERGFTEVAEALADPDFNAFVRRVMFDEIFPTVDLPDAEKRAYAESVLERFANPFGHAKLASIALNSVAKWKTRCLPVVCDYYRLFGKPPENMMRGYDALAAARDAPCA